MRGIGPSDLRADARTVNLLLSLATAALVGGLVSTQTDLRTGLFAGVAWTALQGVWAWARLLRRLHRSLHCPRERRRWWSLSVPEAEALARDLGQQAAEGRYERVQSNLRWLGLTELWASMRSDLSQNHFDERALRFVRQESGFELAALLHLNPRSGEVSGVWQCPSTSGIRAEPVRWPLAGLSGSVASALRHTRCVHARDASATPLLRVGGQRPQVVAEGHAYVVLPLLAQSAPASCLVEGWLHQPQCLQHRPHPQGPQPFAAPARDPGLYQCLSCRHYPVLGALVFQRPAEAAADLEREAQRLGPLASTISALLEHRSLHRSLVAEDRLREGLLDAMWNGVLGTDSRGRIRFANRCARELTGLQEWEGRPLDEMIHLPDPDAIWRALLEGVAYRHADAHLLRRGQDGEVDRIPIRVALNPIATERGAQPGLVCVFEDRSQVQALENEVRHLDTLAAMGRFASALAHEIRNPLAGIQAGIGYLQRQAADEAWLAETLSVMEGEITRLDDILRSLLSVARSRELQVRPCDLRQLCDKVVRSFQPLAREQGRILEVEGPSAVVEADEAMLHQVLANLVKNALEASPPHGRVRVKIDPPSDDGAQGLHLHVEDQGEGLDPEQIPRLFEPFYTRKAGGSGLGLYVCHNFVERHGGRLSAANLSGGGARFTVELPRVPALIGG